MAQKRKSENIILSIGVLISDRSETAEKCLRSLEPICKALPTQVIVTLTAENPRLRVLAERYADVVSEFQWCDDFAAARNENFRHATGEWYMYLDDDEWFRDTENLIGFFKSGFYKQCDGACYIQRNYKTRDGLLYTDDYVSRMVRRVPGMHFVSKIHEYLVPVPVNTCMLDSYVDHYGYIFDSEEDRKRHYERNYKLLQEMIAQEPDNQRLWTHLTSEYLLIQDYSGLREFGERCLEKMEPLRDEETRINRGTFYLSRIMAEDGLKNKEERLKVCQEALRDERNTALCMAFLHWWQAMSLYELERYEEAAQEMRIYLEQQKPVTQRTAEYAIECMALLVSQCYDDTKLQDAYGLLVCTDLRRGNVDNLKKYLDHFLWKKGVDYIFPDLIRTLVRSFRPDGDEIFTRTLEEIHSNEALWEKLWDTTMKLYQEQDTNIKNIFDFYQQAGYGKLAMHYLNWTLQESELINAPAGETYPFYKQKLLQFVREVLGFYQEIYGERFRQKDVLPDLCLMALAAEAAFEVEEDKEDFKHNLTQCAAVYPYLADFIKNMLTAYLLEPGRKQREAREEMKKLRSQMMDKTRAFIDAGQREAAIALAGQLKQIFPEDLEIASLALKAQMSGL